MTILLLGLGIGLLLVLPPGPLSLSIIGLGAQRGVRPALEAGLGVAIAEIISLLAAAGLVLAGHSLPEIVNQTMRWCSIAAILGMGYVLFTRTSQVNDMLDKIESPFRTLAIVTLASPWIFTTWFALLNAAPVHDRWQDLALYGTGLGLGSLLFYVCLAHGSGALSSRLTEAHVQTLSRVGGAVMVVVLGGMQFV